MNIQFYVTDGATASEKTREYAEKKAASIRKVLPKDRADITLLRIELGKEAEGHRNGEIFKVQICADTGGEDQCVTAVGEHFYEAIDKATAEMARLIKKKKGKRQTLVRRGASAIKRLVRGWRR